MNDDTVRCRRCERDVVFETRADGEYCPACGWEKAAAERFQAKFPRGTRRRKKVDRAANAFHLSEDGFCSNGARYRYADILAVEHVAEKGSMVFGGLPLASGQAASLLVTLKGGAAIRIPGPATGAWPALKTAVGDLADGSLEKMRRVLVERSFPHRFRHFKTIIEADGGIRLGVLGFSRAGITYRGTVFPYARADIRYVPDIVHVTLRFAGRGKARERQVQVALKSNADVILPLVMTAYGARIGH